MTYLCNGVMIFSYNPFDQEELDRARLELD